MSRKRTRAETEREKQEIAAAAAAAEATAAASREFLAETTRKLELVEASIAQLEAEMAALAVGGNRIVERAIRYAREPEEMLTVRQTEAKFQAGKELRTQIKQRESFADELKFGSQRFMALVPHLRQSSLDLATMRTTLTKRPDAAAVAAEVVRGMETGFAELDTAAGTFLSPSLVFGKEYNVTKSLASPMYRVCNVTGTTFEIGSDQDIDLTTNLVYFTFVNSPNAHCIKDKNNGDAQIYTLSSKDSEKRMFVMRRDFANTVNYSYIVNAAKCCTWPSNAGLMINSIIVYVPKLKRFDLDQARAHPTINPCVYPDNMYYRRFYFVFKKNLPQFGEGYSDETAADESIEFEFHHLSKIPNGKPERVNSWNAVSSLITRILTSDHFRPAVVIYSAGIILSMEKTKYVIKKNLTTPEPDAEVLAAKRKVYSDSIPAVHLENNAALVQEAFNIARKLNKLGWVQILFVITFNFIELDSVEEGGEDEAWSPDTSPALYFLQSLLQYNLPPGRVYA